MASCSLAASSRTFSPSSDQVCRCCPQMEVLLEFTPTPWMAAQTDAGPRLWADLNPGPDKGEAFLPVFKAPRFTGLSHLPFLGLVRSLSTVPMLLAGEHPTEALRCWASLTGSVPLEEMDFVQTRGIG